MDQPGLTDRNVHRRVETCRNDRTNPSGRGAIARVAFASDPPQSPVGALPRAHHRWIEMVLAGGLVL